MSLFGMNELGLREMPVLSHNNHDTIPNQTIK